MPYFPYFAPDILLLIYKDMLMNKLDINKTPYNTTKNLSLY